jgi:type IV pilus biogenesis protein CpaD/CtpE
MMNTSRIQVEEQTTMTQIPLKDMKDGHYFKIANDYDRYGDSSLHLSLAYDPDSKNYSAVKAFKDMAAVKEKLGKLGVQAKADTIKVKGTEPLLLVTYDSVTAKAPAGCRNMPGFDDGMSTREVGDYRFGCSVDTIIAQQVYRPSDLRGVGDTDPGDGRRSVNQSEYYRQVDKEEAEGDLKLFLRQDIQAQ